MPNDELTILSQPRREDVQFLEDRINEFNYAKSGITDGEELAIFVRGPEDRIIAGLYGWTWGATCEIRFLWVEASMRGQGFGSRLLQAAEVQARARGASQVVLDTHSFQAPDFYRKHGYSIIGVYDDYPRGFQKIFLRKKLD